MDRGLKTEVAGLITQRPFFGTRAFILGCAAVLAVATAIQCHIEATRLVAHTLWTPSLLYGAVLWFWWAGVAILLWQAGKRWPDLWLISKRTVMFQLLIAAAFAFVHAEMLTVTIRFMISRWPYLEGIGYRNFDFKGIEHIGLEILLYTVAWAASAAIHLQSARQEEALHTAELKEQLSSAHLRALQMQLEPHFLFNTLNAITTLVELGRQKEAVQTLSHLNTILKATLLNEAPEKVSLAQELRVVENYLAIEQIRFADRLRVEMSIDPSALDGMVPCFLLQPIVENAIRHGISQIEDDGVIRASIQRKGNLLHLSVRDNGPGLKGKSPHIGHKIGLRNTEERLAHFYPENYGFVSGDAKAGGFEVSITIPYERALV